MLLSNITIVGARDISVKLAKHLAEQQQDDVIFSLLPADRPTASLIWPGLSPALLIRVAHKNRAERQALNEPVSISRP